MRGKPVQRLVLACELNRLKIITKLICGVLGEAARGDTHRPGLLSSP